MFILPVECDEKLGTSITVLLAVSVYLSIVADYLPDTSVSVSTVGFVFRFIF